MNEEQFKDLKEAGICTGYWLVRLKNRKEIVLIVKGTESGFLVLIPGVNVQDLSNYERDYDVIKWERWIDIESL